jgi:hypothetical protein
LGSGCFCFFSSKIALSQVIRGGEDKLWWVSSKRGLFQVKSFLYFLAHSEGSSFRRKSVWTRAPSRVAIFAWSVALGMILTLDNLRKLHVIVMDRCCLCNRNCDSVDHLLLHFMWLMLCGVLSLAILGWHGVMLDMLSTYLLVGGLLEGRGALRCEKLCLFAPFGVYGGK